MDDDDLNQSEASHDRSGDPDVPPPEPPAAQASPSTPRRLRPWLLLGLLTATVGLAVAWFDWNLFKGYVERRVSTATGRDFHIDGDLGVAVSMHPLITLDRLRLANTKGARQPDMASVRRLQLRVSLWPLLHGQTILEQVRVVKPTVLLEDHADGTNNWTFPSSGTTPTIRQFTIDDGTLTYRDDARGTNLIMAVASDRTAATSHLAPILFHGKGIYRKNAFTLQGRTDSPLDLSRTTTPYRIDIDAVAGATHAHASGALRNPLQLTGFDLDFLLAGPDLAQLYPLMGIAAPETPRYHLHGRLGHVGHVWSFDRFTGAVGNSDLAGDVVVDNSGSRKLLKATLDSRRLDVHDLAGFIGAPSHADPAKASTVKQQVEAERAEASDRVLPQQPYDLERLRGMDADVTLRAQHVIGTRVPLDTFFGHLLIDKGVLRLQPLNFDAAGGKVGTTIGLDASRPVIAATARIALRGVDLRELVPDKPMIGTTAGRIGADIDLKGNGNSIAKMLATSDGRVHVRMGGGQVSALLMAYAGLDVARIIKFKIGGDHDIQVRCAAGDFAAQQGIWKADNLVFDSTNTVVRGTGNLDLRDEQLDLLLHVRPRGSSVLSLRSPLRVSGTFKHAAVRPDFKALGLRGAVVAVLGSIALPAAELGLIDVGAGKDSGCLPETAVAKAGTRREAPAL